MPGCGRFAFLESSFSNLCFLYQGSPSLVAMQSQFGVYYAGSGAYGGQLSAFCTSTRAVGKPLPPSEIAILCCCSGRPVVLTTTTWCGATHSSDHCAATATIIARVGALSTPGLPGRLATPPWGSRCLTSAAAIGGPTR